MRSAGFHRRGLAVVIGFACALAMAAPTPAAENDGHDLMKRAIAALPTAPLAARVRLSGDVREAREFVAKHKVVDGARATYIEVVAPESLVGLRFLFKQRVGEPPLRYMKLLAAPGPVLVTSETRADPFLGSTFYLIDLTEPDLDAFTYEIVGKEMLHGRACTLVASTPKNREGEVYGKIIHAIDPKDAVVVRRQFFDQDGRALKEWTAERIEKIDGNWTVRDQRMKFLPGNLESRLEMTEVAYGVEIPDSDFTKEHLAR